MFVIALAGLLIGIVLGLTGAGGGILAVPTLMALMAWSPQQAAPVALIAITAAASLGTLLALHQGLVRYRAASLMALASLPTAFAGSHIAQQLSAQNLQLMFTLLMLALAIKLLAQAHSSHDSDWQALLSLNAHSGHFDWSLSMAAILIGLGASAGFLGGLLGVGGGFILVPALRSFSRLSLNSAIATSLMVVAISGGSGVIIAFARGQMVPVLMSLSFSATLALGLMIGRWWLDRWLPRQLQRAFALLTLSVALLSGAQWLLN